jgi:hypothetical protein
VHKEKEAKHKGRNKERKQSKKSINNQREWARIRKIDLVRKNEGKKGKK